MNEITTRCWICGEEATTGEHRTKKTDLRTEFTDVAQSNPIYFHDIKRKNRIIQSLNSDILKFPKSLCAHCNNARTQPHDMAWAEFSAGIRARQPKILAGSIVRANRIFRYDTARHMINVHLYFVKLVGCHAVEQNIPMDLKTMAQSILKNSACPNIHLRLGIPSLFAGKPWWGASNAESFADVSTAQIARISWLQIFGEFAVQLLYLVPGENCDALASTWHPRLGTSRFVVADFRDEPDKT